MHAAQIAERHTMNVYVRTYVIILARHAQVDKYMLTTTTAQPTGSRAASKKGCSWWVRLSEARAQAASVTCIQIEGKNTTHHAPPSLPVCMYAQQ
mmetsp:Transcript_18647/g.53368  ORF Transcript_18647/g.53368 Transcript_18647/m.53368 type:complete len:95 (+) Transcript_18647:980-1264(+)